MIKQDTPMPMRDAFIYQLYEKMKQDERIFFLSADFGSPALDRIRSDLPKQFINTGIAEQNMINVASGLSIEGNIVFAYAIAPFISMRCFEQTRINLALLSEVRHINVNLIGVGAGYSYVVSGPTHQCLEDISVMRSLPNIQVYSPSDHLSATALIEQAITNTAPKYFRFDVQPLPVLYSNQKLDIAKGFHLHMSGKETLIIATGYMVHTALKAAKETGAAVLDMMNLSCFDQQALLELLSNYQSIITVEEGVLGKGGLDSLVSRLVLAHDLPVKVRTIGTEGGFRFDLGSREQLHEQAGIGINAVISVINAL